MSRPVIVVGDRTSHGGVVLTGSQFSDVDGKGIARIGDKVTCPQKGHGSVTTIVTGDVTDIIDGSPVARHGDKTACGATLVSSQILTYTDDGSDSGKNASSAPATADSLAGNETNEKPKPYDEQTKLIALPIEGVPYHIETKDKRTFSGRVGKDGLLPRIDTDSADEYTVCWGDKALAKTNGG